MWKMRYLRNGDFEVVFHNSQARGLFISHRLYMHHTWHSVCRVLSVSIGQQMSKLISFCWSSPSGVCVYVRQPISFCRKTKKSLLSYERRRRFAGLPFFSLLRVKRTERCVRLCQPIMPSYHPHAGIAEKWSVFSMSHCQQARVHPTNG